MDKNTIEAIIEANDARPKKLIARDVATIIYGEGYSRGELQDAYRYLEGGSLFRHIEEEYIIAEVARSMSLRAIKNADWLSHNGKVKATALKKRVSIRQAQRLV